MFDGQHKTLAVWLSGRESVAAKVYLDLSTSETVSLVNSIQARIPKLPLSTFELSAKMDDENSARLDAYLAAVGAAATEKGFIDSVEQAVRERVRTAFRLALAHAVIENPDLLFISNVGRAGERATGDKITENVFKTKVVDNLLYRIPLEDEWSVSDGLRGHEQDNIIQALNRLHNLVFAEPVGGFSAQESDRRKRMSYQSALAFIAQQILQGLRAGPSTDEGREMLDKEPDAAQWKLIDAALQRLADHPIWTASWGLSAKTAAVETALTKNQEANSAFRAVGSRPGTWWEPTRCRVTGRPDSYVGGCGGSTTSTPRMAAAIHRMSD